MTTKTEGEQELVLGNKQLLGIFFVVVALLGVFFTMGYIIGRNTANSSAAATASGGGAASRSDAVNDKPVDSPPPAPVPSPSSEPPVSTAPAQTTPAETAAAPPVERPVERPAAKPEAETPKKGALREIPAGDLYLQVAAIHKTDALTMVKVLRERGFPALIGESSKENLFRVLVGPFKDVTALHISKDELKKAGFESIVAK